MGANCICDYHSASDKTPNVVQPHLVSINKLKARKQYQNIIAVKEISEDGTNRELLKLTEDIASCVNKYEQINGKLTKNFDAQVIDTERIRLEFDHISSQFQLSCNHRQNTQLKLEINIQQQQQIKQDEQFVEQNTKKIKQKFIQTKIKSLQMQSLNISHEQSTINEQQSCKLLNPYNVLNSSLFTQRRIQKQQFYNDQNKINGTILQQWKQQNQIQSCSLKFLMQNWVQIAYDQAMVSFISIGLFEEQHHLSLITRCDKGIKVFVNGIPRLLLTAQFDPQALTKIIKQLRMKQATNYISLDIFLLSGWLPEVIQMNDINSFTSLMQRLAINLEEGSLILSFSNQTTKHALIIMSIDVETQTVMSYAPFLNSISTTFCDNFCQNRNVLDWKVIAELYDKININWNVQIYDMRFTFTGKNQSCFHMAILDNVEDTEMRFLVERHRIDKKESPFVLYLYDYEEYTIDYRDNKPIKVITGGQYLYSAVAVFQACAQQTQYVLRMECEQPQAYFTLGVYSFADIDVVPFAPKKLQQSVKCSSLITAANKGGSINSPYFANNLQYAVTASRGCALRIRVQLPQDYQYEVGFIPTSQNISTILQVPLSTIMSNLTVSQIKKGCSQILMSVHSSTNILMINSYTAINCTANITIDLFGMQQSDTSLNIKQLIWAPFLFYKKQINWLPSNSGPRKRLRSNTSSEFQPVSVFKEFLKNPYQDRSLDKGCYLFHIQDLSYKKNFDSNEEQILCDPPAISLAIFQISSDSTKMRIVQDDAYYVPFGFGFWSQPIILKSGIYRFVFPKMEIKFSKGLFEIFICK